MIKAGFILINRNNGETIKRCIQSLYKFCGKEAEYIVVDDQSTDDSLEQIKDLDYINLIKNKSNLGISESRNIGFNSSTADLLFVIDTDIVVDKLNLEFISQLFEKNPRLVGISGSYKSAHKGRDWNIILDIRREDIYFKKSGTYIYDINTNYTTFSGGFCVLKRSRVGNIIQRGEKGVAGEDILYQMHLLNKGFEFAFSDQLRGVHYHRRNEKQGKEKIVSLVKGGLYVSFETLAMGERLPAFDPLYSFPISWLFALFFPPIILWNFIVPLVLITTKRQKRYIRLLFYLVKYDLIKIWVFFTGGYLSKYGVFLFVKTLIVCSVNSYTGKVNWMLRTFFGNNILSEINT